MLILCLIFLNKDHPFIPGITLLLPCILTALFIHTAHHSHLTTRLLSSKPITFIGKISYSLYLYHWIFISFAYYITGVKQLESPIIAIILIFTAVFSLAGYYLIEQPIRKRQISFKKAFIFLYLIPSLAVVGYNLYSRKHLKQNMLNRQQSLIQLENHFPPTVITIGDSHAEHLRLFLDYVGQQEGWKSEILNSGPECQVFVDMHNRLADACLEQWEKIKTFDAVFISQFYDLKMGEQPVPRFKPQSFIIPAYPERLKETVRKIAEIKPVYVFANNTSISRSPEREQILAKFHLSQYLQPISVMGDIDHSNQTIYNLIKDIPNVHWVDAQQYLPRKITNINGQPLYKDQDHLTDFGAYYMGQEFHKHQKLLK